MKNHLSYIATLLGAVIFATPVFGQSPEPVFASVGAERLPVTIGKESSPAAVHMNTFWDHYDHYRDRILSVTLREHEAVKDLAHTGRNTKNEEALLNGMRMISCSLDELLLKRVYFGDISEEKSGIFGLNFLQMEVMLDMVESSKIYEQTDLRNFHFLPDSLSADQRWKAKYGMLVQALGLTPIEEKIFLPVFMRFDQEAEETLGEQYNVYAVFSRDPSDYTPALAKRNGYDLLDMMEREVRLKEKYFNEVNTVLGSSVAARFLAWEDYYSIQCKLSALSGN
jgi:hypothetical protein